MGFILGLFVGVIMTFALCYSALTDDYVDDEEKELWSKY